MPDDELNTPNLIFRLGDRTGIFLLALSVFLSVVNSLFFAVATRLPVAPISRGGLVLNSLALLAAWFAFARGKRAGLVQQLAAVVLLSVVHYFVVCNVWAVAHFGL
ncbi:hypothetical protein [Haloferula sp. BvORR071]|uniref:hypothetical protein n=1 Tax=Haloferula sp. BvORR071 TaxID=1396141 RepID=UPI00054F64F0|nr:hypothetical protein [Haloferula sp. BvORR071]